MTQADKADMADAISGDTAFDVFASDSPVAHKQKALKALMREKLIPKQADDARFKAGLAQLTQVAVDRTEEPETRLLAIACVVHAAQMVKRLQPNLQPWLAPAMGEDFPPLQLLKEADDRLNVARALALADGTWLAAYLADAIAYEETGEKAREELIAALLARSETLAELFGRVAQAMAGVRPETEKPGDSIGRRQARTLSALRALIPTSELEAGDELGKALHALVSLPLRAVGRPKEEKVQHELAEEVVLLTHEIVRSRFSVATDPAVFQAVAYCRQMLGGSTWPDALQGALSLLVKDVREALILLGRQGVRDQGLLEQLDMLCNYPLRARAIAKEIAERHPELDEDTRQWLIHGRVVAKREASSTALEAAAREADVAIGLALNAAREARQAVAGVKEPVISVLDIYEQSLVSVTQDCFQRFEGLLLQMDQVAQQRSLALYGEVGQEVDFAPKYFQAVGEVARQKVVIRQPAVVRIRKDGTAGDVVLKGLVE
ncbi:MAG TPA: hypothetical protein PK725_01225 [Rhodocyclaceae bacterium]|nr:hypothetical protein [Rhodocyclaceae bacterium]